MQIKNLNLGFMQGRLTPMKNGVIQEFPAENWENEILCAAKLGFSLIEWTIDYWNFEENPVLQKKEHNNITQLLCETGVRVESITADCCMQAPFWKSEGLKEQQLLDDFKKLTESAAQIGIRQLILPLVDNGSLTSQENAEKLYKSLIDLGQLPLKIAFEVDLPPEETANFISLFPKESFGINYDTGNSASLGHNPTAEFRSFGERITNVHIKDRLFRGSSVPLGLGDAQLKRQLELLLCLGYQGNLILQTARSEAGHDEAALISSVKYLHNEISS